MVKKTKIPVFAPTSKPSKPLIYEVGFLILSVSFPATEGIEEKSSCTPFPSTTYRSPLKSFLIVLRLFSAASSLPA